jgi:hypothetical protein
MVPVLSSNGTSTSPDIDGAARGGEHVAAHEAVHPRDADRAEQGADRRGDERDEQSDQRRDRDVGVGVVGEGLQRDDDDDEDQRQRGEQDVQGDLVGGLAPLGALDEGDLRSGRIRRTWVISTTIRSERTRAARDRAAVAARLADDGATPGDGRLVDGGVPSTTVPSPGMTSASTTTRLPRCRSEAGASSVLHLRDGLGAHGRSVGLRVRGPRPAPRRSWRTRRWAATPSP